MIAVYFPSPHRCFYDERNNEHLSAAIIVISIEIYLKICPKQNEKRIFYIEAQLETQTYHDNDEIQPTPGIIEIGFKTQSNPFD